MQALRCTHMKHQIAYHFNRSASTSSHSMHKRHPEASHHKFPFPHHMRHPTPHQIFHLPRGATQAEIKARYYDLVRDHHPDSVETHHLEVAERQRRFQAIQGAYDVLRGKVSSMHAATGDGGFGASAAWEYAAEVAKRKRRAEAAYNKRAYNESEWGFSGQRDWTASADDRWKDRGIIYFAIACVLAGFAPALFYGPTYTRERHTKAVHALGLARQDANEVDALRRERMKERVQDYYRARPKDQPSSKKEPENEERLV